MSLREPAAGSRFGDLEVEAEVGAGAFGRVFRARDTLIDRVVALKVLKKPGDAPPRAGERERFLAEARAVGSFNHPHIVTLYHVHGVEGGGFVLEMEYVDGGSLEDRLAGGERIPPEQALAIARDVAAALGAAHAARVVHGDVKPGNVLTTRDGRVKLVDFGLARFLGAHDPTPGGTGIEGTPYYMAPEVIQGEGYLPASDVWSLGVVLHRMLSGRLPFDAPDFDGLFCAIQNQPPAPLDAPLPARVLSLVHRCLAKRPSERFPDGSALATALSEALDRFATGASVSPAVAAAQQPGLPTLAGRSQETERMVAALHRLRLRTGGLVLVTGPAGLGKSALVGATAVEARRLGVPVVSSRVSAVEGLLRPLAGALGGLGPAAGDPTTTSSGRAAPLPGAEVERALAARAAGEPTVVVLEDLQHASAEDLRTLLRLCRRLSGSAILWLLTERTSDVGLAGSRPPNAQPLLDVPGAVRVDLGPLPPEAIVAVLEGAAERTPFSPDLLDLLVRHSGGNPLFALQWFAHLRERGLAAREGGEWIARDPEAAALAPPEIRSLVRRRVQALPSGTRALLDIAAVDGFEFDGEALAFVLRRPLLTVLRTLQSLFRTHGVVVPREHGYRFASPFLQEVLYEDVAPDLRREIHRAWRSTWRRGAGTSIRSASAPTGSGAGPGTGPSPGCFGRAARPRHTWRRRARWTWRGGPGWTSCTSPPSSWRASWSRSCGSSRPPATPGGSRRWRRATPACSNTPLAAATRPSDGAPSYAAPGRATSGPGSARGTRTTCAVPPRPSRRAGTSLRRGTCSA